mgnify:FL=1
MSISGTIEAHCKECKCRFTCNIDNWIFIDEEVIGTCDNCFNKISHDCTDELSLDENECFEVVGRKEFTDEERALRKKEIDESEYCE